MHCCKLVFEGVVVVEPGADHLLKVKDGRRAILLLETSLQVLPELVSKWFLVGGHGYSVFTSTSGFGFFIALELVELNFERVTDTASDKAMGLSLSFAQITLVFSRFTDGFILADHSVP